MKKIIFCLILIFSVFFISCNSNKEPESNNYKITFTNALDEVVKEYVVKEGESIVYPTSEEMQTEGYRFLDSFDSNITTASSDKIIKGNYIKVWTVNFYNESNEIISTQIIDEGSSATSPEVTPKDGYIFKGWETDFNNITSDLEIYGSYEIITYTLNYISNIESSITCEYENNSKIALNTTVTLSAKEVTGYTFLGFYERNELLTSDLQYSFEMTEDRNISAEYALINLEVVYENGIPFVYFGSYPQTLLEDTSLIALLNQKETDSLGYITHNGITYCKVTAKINGGKSCKSISGKTVMKNGEVYYFFVEPIKWRVISINKNTYELFSEFTLDSGVFYGGIEGDLKIREIDGKSVFANNYEYSDVRKYLNEVFYNNAFSSEDKQIIETTFVDNSSKTGLDFNSDMDPTAYACDDTNDKVYLLSYKDYQKKPINKQGRATDFAIAKGCWVQQSASYKNYTFWWFRTPNPAYSDITWFDLCALVSDEEGIFDWNLFVVYDYVGYRPAITALK